MTLRWVPGWNGLTEPEAVSYVAAVEAADGQELEFGVAKAINDFVLGCKNDGIWDAIKASCILAGARTLNGALVPLVGTAPTNYNFVSGDYDRETGLVGDRSTKYLDSNRNNNADPQNSQHITVFATVGPSDGIFGRFAGAGSGTTGRSMFQHTSVTAGTSQLQTRSRSNASTTSIESIIYPCLLGISRNTSSAYSVIKNQSTNTINTTSEAPTNETIDIFTGTVAYTDARLAFYSIGESLDLAALDTRVSALITAIGAAIP
jgi:hypothetical protein